MSLEEPMKTVSSCCNAPTRVKEGVIKPSLPAQKVLECTDCGDECTLTWPPCPLNICDGSGITIENAGYCGGCDTCGSREETEKPCPHTL